MTLQHELPQTTDEPEKPKEPKELNVLFVGNAFDDTDGVVITKLEMVQAKELHIMTLDQLMNERKKTISAVHRRNVSKQRKK